MDIYVVQPGDDINSIAEKYGVSAAKLIQDNELSNPDDLVLGQTIVIVYPEQTYTVQEGDTLGSIADAFGISYMQILRNNPYITTRGYLISGETLAISYNTNQKVVMNGFTYPYIKRETLLKTLPNLTYLSVFNYRATGEGEIIAYYDDADIIRIAIDYGVVPLMMTTTLSPQGEPDLEVAYEILLNEEYQERHIDNILNMMKTKGYYGLNMAFNYINKSNYYLYENLIKKVSDRLKKEGFLYVITINPNIKNVNSEIVFDKIDFTGIYPFVDSIIFLQFIWGTNYGPPAPVSSINNLKTYLDYVISIVPSEKIIIGKPFLGYDWTLPYIQGLSSAHSLTIDIALNIARGTGAIIQFDEISQTPFFYYNQIDTGAPGQHIVWFIDARSSDALLKLFSEDSLLGIGIWSIMVYNPQLWLIVNSQYDVVKVLPID